MMSFASVPLRLSERVSARGCDPVSVTDAWHSVEASATMPEVSAEVVAASKVKRTFRLARPTGTYVPEKLGPSLDCALHVPSAATVIEVTKAPRSLPRIGTPHGMTVDRVRCDEARQPYAGSPFFDTPQS